MVDSVHWLTISVFTENADGFKPMASRVSKNTLLFPKKMNPHIFQIHTSTTHVLFPCFSPFLFLPSSQVLPFFLTNKQKKILRIQTSTPRMVHPGRKKVVLDTRSTQLNRGAMTEGSMLAAICVIFCMSCVWDGEVFFFVGKKWADHVYICMYIHICECYWKSQEVQRFKDWWHWKPLT